MSCLVAKAPKTQERRDLVVKQAENPRVQELVKKIENHPH